MQVGLNICGLDLRTKPHKMNVQHFVSFLLKVKPSEVKSEPVLCLNESGFSTQMYLFFPLNWEERKTRRTFLAELPVMESCMFGLEPLRSCVNVSKTRSNVKCLCLINSTELHPNLLYDHL